MSIDAVPRPGERRAEPRLDVAIRARLRTADGVCHEATIRNISGTGLLVQVAHASIAALLPNVRREQPKLPVCVQAQFQAGAAAISVECGIAHIRRIPAGECLVGLEFRDFQGSGAAHLGEFYRKLSLKFARPEGAT